VENEDKEKDTYNHDSIKVVLYIYIYIYICFVMKDGKISCEFHVVLLLYLYTTRKINNTNKILRRWKSFSSVSKNISDEFTDWIVSLARVVLVI
jgi:hypothetical protein